MTLKIALSGNDRTRPIKDGRVSLGQAPFEFVDGPIEELFSMAFLDAPFEFTEISFSNYLISVANGSAKYTGLPIFTSRSFRHSAIYVREGAGIERPADLVGRRVGLREFTNTAALVVRGLLADEYGVSSSEIEWFAGDIDAPERTTIPVPSIPGTSVTPVVGEDLSSLMLDGRLDALVAYHPPRCFSAGSGVKRLFPDYPADEADYFRRTNHFPIMHLLAVRKDVADRLDVVASVAEGFAEAKKIAVTELFDQQALKVMLPWIAVEAQRTFDLLGTDYWSYGLRANRHVLEKQVGFAVAQGLIPRRIELSELFIDSPAVEAALAR